MKIKRNRPRIFERRKLWRTASFTLEASILMPMILFLMMLILTGAMVLHDACVASFNAESITIRGRMLAVGHYADPDTELADYLSEEGERGFLMTGSIAAEGNIGTWKITSSVSGSVQNVFSKVFSSWGWPVWSSFSASEEEWFTDPCSLIRQTRILLEENENE